MKRKIIVACGRRGCDLCDGGGRNLRGLCQNHNIPVELIQCQVNEIETYIRWCAFDMHHCQSGS